eukprot:CAMPEP_0184481266 /NCGR_PEP_ID=MMETSP0113_2-20130426/2817_1 /TAXON_ID=91329 /ORGANISM="Norrisiella sphaerica, Strain BC52" /LENGTH=706 /DNA_ID=CAMNT_0026860285 /DNA_START=640 /DNA_END=2757 /DNA_ORIENTATION=-
MCAVASNITNFEAELTRKLEEKGEHLIVVFHEFDGDDKILCALHSSANPHLRLGSAEAPSALRDIARKRAFQDAWEKLILNHEREMQKKLPPKKSIKKMVKNLRASIVHHDLEEAMNSASAPTGVKEFLELIERFPQTCSWSEAKCVFEKMLKNLSCSSLHREFLQKFATAVLQEFFAEAGHIRDTIEGKKLEKRYLEFNGLAVHCLRLQSRSFEDPAVLQLCGEVHWLFNHSRGLRPNDSLGVSMVGGPSRVSSCNTELDVWRADKVHEANVIHATKDTITLRFRDLKPVKFIPRSAKLGREMFRVVRMAHRVTLQRELKALETILVSDPRVGHSPSESIRKTLLSVDVPEATDVKIAEMCNAVVLERDKLSSDVFERYLHKSFSVLNPSQTEALIAGVSRRIVLIQGPPGTGKTRVACHILNAWRMIDRESRCLAAAGSNVAVDNIWEGLKNIGLKAERIGRDYSSLEDGRPLQKADVICATCCGVGSRILKNIHFQCVLIDESTQITEPELLIALSRGCEQLVLIGDHKQLEPTVISQEAEDFLRISLFEKLIKKGVEPLTLKIQYRMHPAIAAFPSSNFYQGVLKSGVKPEDRLLEKFNWPRKDYPLAFMHVDGKERSDGNSYINVEEVKACVHMVQLLIKNCGLKENEIGVVTPYKSQERKISKALREPLGSDHEVEVSTVDGFQGREKEFIIISFVRANW